MGVFDSKLRGAGERNPDGAPGDWFIDRACFNCGATRAVAPGLIVEKNGMSVFARQPASPEEEAMAWRAMLVCPTASVRTVSKRKPPDGVFPEELAPGVYRCGYNARSSYGAQSYFVRRGDGNFMVDAPRFASKLVRWFEAAGGLADILLTHQDDVADADRYAERFSARVWIHHDDRRAAPYATDILEGREPTRLRPTLLAIPVPGHTRGSVVFLLDDTFLFTGDSLAWSHAGQDLQAFRGVCWYSWEEQTRSLAGLAAYRFEWVLAGHGGSVQLPADEMRARLGALVARMGAA